MGRVSSRARAGPTEAEAGEGKAAWLTPCLPPPFALKDFSKEARPAASCAGGEGRGAGAWGGLNSGPSACHRPTWKKDGGQTSSPGERGSSTATPSCRPGRGEVGTSGQPRATACGASSPEGGAAPTPGPPTW